MRRVKSAPLVTGQLYRRVGVGAVLLGLVVALLMGDGSPREPAPLPQLARGPGGPAGGTYKPRSARPSQLAWADQADHPEPSTASFDASDTLAFAGGALDPAGEPGNFAPPLGNSRDLNADRPTPQQLRMLIEQSYRRSGSYGGGD